MLILQRALIAGICLLAAASAHAQTYPDRLVRIINPYPAGASVDVIGRIIAAKLSESLGQQFIVESRSGAGGNIGADFVAKAEPDGYTLLISAPGPLVVNQTLYSHLSFNPAKDFAPIALAANIPIVLMVHPSVQANNVQELIELARRQPGKINFGSSGIGTTNHLAGELLKTMAKIDIVHVPYRGAAPAMNDLIGGHIPMLFDNMPGSLPQITSGKARGIGHAGAERAAVLPELPTVAEQGVPGFDASSWFGIVAPAKTPAPVLAKLTEEIQKILKMPDIIARFNELGAEPGTLFGKDFGAFMQAESDKWAGVIRASGAKAE
ncbi:MAG TPA: tripartite tricarboxylate transporter substrate binding protein [Xanthobacteraceae bacterium]|jgi:tripartite-type tricarboxylate transporter receptor subunit TctC